MPNAAAPRMIRARRPRPPRRAALLLCAGLAAGAAPAQTQTTDTGTTATTGTATQTAAQAGAQAGAAGTAGGPTTGTGGLTLRLTFTPAITWRDNPDFVANPAGGAETTLGTGFALGFLSQTRTQKLSFSASGFYDTDTDVGRDGLVDPQLRFNYSLDGANARVTAFASYRQLDLDDSRFTLDIDGDGIDDQDPVITASGGFREEASYGIGLQTGLRSPFGLAFDLTRRDRNFADTIDPTLFDFTETTAALQASFRINPSATVRLTSSRKLYEAEDTVATERTTTKTGVGASLLFSPVLRLDADLTQDRVETETTGGTTVREGTGLDLALTRTMPNGTLSGQFVSSVDQNGRRETLIARRSLTLPDAGALTLGFGAARAGSETRPLVELAYARGLKNGQIAISFDRTLRSSSTSSTATVDSTLNASWTRDLGPVTVLSVDLTWADADALPAGAQDRTRTQVGVGVNHALSPVDSLSANVLFGTVEFSGTGTTTTEERFDLGLDYRRTLPRNWALVASYDYRARTGDAIAGRFSNTVSLGLQKVIDLKP